MAVIALFFAGLQTESHDRGLLLPRDFFHPFTNAFVASRTFSYGLLLSSLEE